MFTRRHYILIAATVRAIIDDAIKKEHMDKWIVVFDVDNPHFDEQLFRDACDCTSDHNRKLPGFLDADEVRKLSFDAMNKRLDTLQIGLK